MVYQLKEIRFCPYIYLRYEYHLSNKSVFRRYIRLAHNADGGLTYGLSYYVNLYNNCVTCLCKQILQRKHAVCIFTDGKCHIDHMFHLRSEYSYQYRALPILHHVEYGRDQITASRSVCHIRFDQTCLAT